MINKVNRSMASVAVNAGLLLSSLVVGNVSAAECGQAKLVEAGSSGVAVTKNSCQEPLRITLGSVLELSSNSRMWLKFDPSSKGELVQLICQNKSSEAIKVDVTSTNTPWIKPQGLKDCEPWKNNKLSCVGSGGEKNSFFCAVASAKSERSGTGPDRTTSVTMKEAQPELTTSVKMRSITLPVAVPVEDIIKTMKPDIELCKSLYSVSEKLDMSWTISVGKIQDLSVNSENKDLVDCVEDVVKQANANQDLSIKHAF